jgi:hypothetical protein
MLRPQIALPFALLIAAPAVSAQASNDESRLVVGILGGWIGGSELWSTTQPVFANGNRTDQFRLVRDMRANITMAGQLTYFPRPGFGVTGEITYIGLGSRDGCRLVVDNGDTFNRAACAAIDGRNRAASAVTASAGVLLRASTRGDVQPYLRANAGIALVPRSTTTMVAFFGEDDALALVIYEEDESRAAKPLGAVSFGLATAPRAGYQLRMEARLTAVQLQVVTGPAPSGSPTPPRASQWSFLPSVSVGLDVVLEKRRGRRY